jgi:uncharacterized protein (TIGR03435 family)
MHSGRMNTEVYADRRPKAYSTCKRLASSLVCTQEMRKLFVSLLVLTCGAFGQAADTLSFEVATVKPAEPIPGPGGGRGMIFMGRRGGPGTQDPGQITWSKASLKDLLIYAYDVNRYQVTGPDWLDTERFEIVAKVVLGTTDEQVRKMWQNLLAERFGVVIHHESKVFQVEELVVAKGGPKLKESTMAAAKAADEPPPPGPENAGIGPPKLDKNGAPELTAPGLMMMMTMGPNGPNAHLVGKDRTMAQLAANIAGQISHPVVDKTGLTGKYDFALEFAPEPGSFPRPGGMPPAGPGPGGDGGPQIPGAADPTGLPLAGALQQQLGLKLQANKAPLDVIVVDRGNKTPTEN